MLKKIIFAIILGIFGTIFFAQYDSWTHKKIVSLFQKMSKESLGGNFSCSVQAVNFFSPSITLHDVEMVSSDSDLWLWRCKKCEVTCSWLQLLFKGTLDQHVIMDGFECRSRVENSCLAIEPHMIAMMQQSFLPFSSELKSVVFKNGCLYADDGTGKNEVSLFFNSSSLRIGNQIKTTMSIGDGQLTYEKNKYVEKVAVDLSLISEYIGDTFDLGMQVAGTFVLSHLGNQGGCYLTGGWKSNRGRFSIHNAYNSLMIDPIIITERELRMNGRFPLSYAVKCARNSLADQVINGAAHFSVKVSRDESHTIDGLLVVEDVKLNQHHVCDMGKFIFERHDDDWKMRLLISRYNQECKGTGYWHESDRKGELSIKNVTDFAAKAFTYWRIKHNNFFVHVTAQDDKIQGNYQATATNILSAATHSTKGSFSVIEGVLAACGLIDAHEFAIDAALYPEIVVKHCSYKDKEHKDLITLQATDDTKEVCGSISFPFVRSMINTMLHYDVQGEGNLDVVAKFALPEIVVDFTLKDATIRLPQTYNFIDGLHAHCVCNVTQKSAVLEDVTISLHTGKISCLRATSYFDDNGALVFTHAPLIVDRCLLNVKKDLFAIVSGNLLFAKSLTSPASVSGHIIIDKAQLKENLFSGIIQKQLLSYTHSVFSLPDVPLYCDLAIETKSPIRVDTGFFQTNAHVNLRVKKERHEPSVTGSIVLHSGTLNFPYKPLYISKGIITFTPEQLFDPMIELIARNKIKKYDVSLQVEGSLLTHHIVLDATPPLTEEQIVGLLLVGAEENSLNSMMPALIVQNLKSLIFSNNQLSFFDKYFKPLLGTLNINLVPSFTDQTGRGGLRGALEITVDDRWRAVIQKNFSLTEDTKFELEFLFSDDITLRAIRDERRDLGGEVEMRWKF
ncbi:MAG TPA: translocation/assembly module TamB domain-containing protein [Candidatus Babeliales bacterium]|nr:translocation/assembly module TamB domain-containing protein [Candidatus Babeliales bacterium]